MAPILYIIGGSRDLIVLFIYQTATTWPGLIIVLTGIPAYFIWKDLRRGYVRGRINLRRSQAKHEYQNLRALSQTKPRYIKSTTNQVLSEPVRLTDG